MKTRFSFFQRLLLGASLIAPCGTLFATVDESPSQRSTIQSLSPEQINNLISLLQSNYLDPTPFNDIGLKRTILNGMLLQPGTALVEPPKQKDSELPIRPAMSEILNDNLFYFRLGSLDPANIAILDQALESAAPKIVAAVIDLRDTPTSNRYDLAAEVAKRFIEKGKPLFELKSPKTGKAEWFTSTAEPLFTGLIMVITHPGNRQAAEVLAATLRQNVSRAMLIGAPTPGDAVEYATFPIPDSPYELKIGIALAELPSGQPLFPKGIQPDISITMDPILEQEIFSTSLTSGMKPFILDKERARFNEAALVSGNNPELEIYIKRKGSSVTKENPLRDSVLQRAIDVVTAVNVLGKSE